MCVKKIGGGGGGARRRLPSLSRQNPTYGPDNCCEKHTCSANWCTAITTSLSMHSLYGSSKSI
jgi:hypothetical protein